MTKGPLSLWRSQRAFRLCFVCEVGPPALPVGCHHDGEHAHGGCRVVRGLSTVAEIAIRLVKVSMQEVALSG